MSVATQEDLDEGFAILEKSLADAFAGCWSTNVQKGSGTIWTLDDELARLSNVQIVPDPFWTLAAPPTMLAWSTLPSCCERVLS